MFTTIKRIGILLSILSNFCSCEKTPLLQTPLGLVRGTVRTSFGGRKFSAYEGIPFAKPPIGQRRFEPPEPIEPWHGIWEAVYPTKCAQTDYLSPNVTTGDEDCLHLNVYVPRREPNPNDSLDVIVHIHGGAYMYGHGHKYAHPKFLMDEDVIFITFNYRVGVFGFLSTEDEVVPGNNGMKDQVMALKWIQCNVGSFGGNPGSVTITGMSAGSSSVHLHYFSDMSKGLFHRGFAQSGVALNPYSTQEGALEKARIIANAVGCSSTNTTVLVECLKERRYKQILANVGLVFGYKVLPFIPFGPIVEKGGKSTAFLKADPYYLLSKGQVHDLPLIISTVAHEGYFPVILSPQDLDYFNKNWETVAPIILYFDYSLEKSSWSEVSAKIRRFYFGDGEINVENMDKLVQLIGDRTFYVGAEMSARMQAQHTKSPVYYYHFSYSGDNEDKTVAHSDDCLYIFGSAFSYSRPLTENELKMKETMVGMLVAFAKTGIPSINGVLWEPVSNRGFSYLNISGLGPEGITMKTVDDFSPKEFWNSLGFLENENLLKLKDEL